MTVGDRRDSGTALCHRLAARVADIAPEGVGRWDRAWDIVAPADVAFMIALNAWESDPTENTKDCVKAAYNDVLDAWRRAAAEFEESPA